MRLSVIVPVYNVEQYLSRCLDSLLRQGLEPEDWEVICVNDGSPDNCATILAEYEKKHPDVFRIISQKNQGLGEARNVGTAQAQGEWVTYLDSDDYLVDGAYRYLLDHFCGDVVSQNESVKLNVLCYGFRDIYTDGEKIVDPDAKPDGKIVFEGDGADVFNQLFIPHVWSKFYRRAFLQEYHIEQEIVISQDVLFNFEVFSHHPYTRLVTSSVVRYENSNVFSAQKIVNKEVVLVQLNDLYYNMGVIRRYLEMDNASLAPAVHRQLSYFQEIYYNKMIRTDLRHEEWKKYTRVLNVEKKSESLMNIKKGWKARALGKLKMMVGHSYVEYRLVSFLYRVVFRRFFLKRIYGA